MEIKSRNTVELVYSAEGGEYILSLPVGSAIDEAISATAAFVQVLSNLKSKEQKEKDEHTDPDQGDVPSSQDG